MSTETQAEPRSHPVEDIALDFDLSFAEAGADQLGRLHAVGAYWLWSQVYPASHDPWRLFEWTDAGIADLTTEHYSLHTVKAGVAYHVEGLFDYWLVSDADHLWLQMPHDDARRYVLMAGGRTHANRYHSLTWYCRACGTALGAPSELRHNGTPAGFLAAQAEAVRAFNADPAARTCSRCGAQHPLAREDAFGLGDDVPNAGDTRVSGLTSAEDDVPAGAPLARLSELAENTPRVVRTQGKEIVLVRIGNQLRALNGVCPHKSGPLGSGEVRNGTITCPWHRFRFRLDDGCSATNPSLRAPTYEVSIQGDDVYVALPSGASHQQPTEARVRA